MRIFLFVLLAAIPAVLRAASTSQEGTNALLRAVIARDRLRSQVTFLEQRNVDAASRVTLTILDAFIPQIENDLRNGLRDRAARETSQLIRMGERETKRAEFILAGREKGFFIPRNRVDQLGSFLKQMIRDRRMPDGGEQKPQEKEEYDRFARVVRDMDRHSSLCGKDSLWNSHWILNEAGYDFRRSVSGQPVLYSPLRLFEEREACGSRAEYLYSALWQSVLHGQSVTNLPAWERIDAPENHLDGSTLYEPECLEAAGRCVLDLLRLADKLSPLQNEPPSILLHWSSNASGTGEQAATNFFTCYAAASFLGQALGIVTDSQLALCRENGKTSFPFPAARVILLPDEAHLSEEARSGLKRLHRAGVRIFDCGSTSSGEDFERIPPSDIRGLHAFFALRRETWDLPQKELVREAESDTPAFGVECRSVWQDGKNILVLCNHLRVAKTVRISRQGKDLITGKDIPVKFSLAPMQVMLIEPSGTQQNELVLCSWNLENLFDTEDDPDNKGDDGFTPRGWMRWTANRYRMKLEHLSDIIVQMKPHILCVMEVENRVVLEDLSRTLRERHQFSLPAIVHRDSEDKRGIDVAILAAKEPDSVTWLCPSKGLRDTPCATFTFQGRPITVMANHWKSKLGKKAKSDALRTLCASVVRKELDRRLRLDSHAAIVVTGDFNDESDSAALVKTGLFTTDRDVLSRDATGRFLFNLAATLPPEESGTYYYAAGNKWNMIDTMVITRGMLNGTAPWHAVEGSYQIFKTPRQCTKKGTPLPFRRVRVKGAGDFYQTGYSDHFPILLRIR